MTLPRTETEHFNGLAPGADERLAFLAEEAAEVIQAVTKIQRHGWESRYGSESKEAGRTNREHLEIELGELEYAVALLTAACDLEPSRIRAARQHRVERIDGYMHHQGRA